MGEKQVITVEDQKLNKNNMGYRMKGFSGFGNSPLKHAPEKCPKCPECDPLEGSGGETKKPQKETKKGNKKAVNATTWEGKDIYVGSTVGGETVEWTPPSGDYAYPSRPSDVDIDFTADDTPELKNK